MTTTKTTAGHATGARRLGRRLMLAGFPALLLASLAANTIWGDNGLLARHTLRGQLEASQTDLARLDRDNERLLLELNAMERDAVVIERMIADEIGWAPEGAVVVKFD